MDRKILIVAIAAAALGIVAGFLLANTMNRSEINSLRAEAEQLRKTTSNRPPDPSLTADEISRTVARSEENPNDFDMQQNVGVALYRYAAAKEDVPLLKQSIQILERALKLRPNDKNIILTLGNANFDVGYFSQDNASLQRAREFYAKTLSAKPDDVDVQTDLGLTYFLETPPNLDRSVTEFRKSLSRNPKHEKTLQFITQALARQNKYGEAAQYLEQLRSVNPKNGELERLAAMLTKQQPAG